MLSQCKLCMNQEKLIKAHIIPRFFYAPSTYLVSYDKAYKQRRPIGVYDPNILCETCDQFIGKEFDEFAKRILIEREGVNKVEAQTTLTQKLIYYKLSNKNDYSRLARFFISIFWRASVSSYEDLTAFSLGDYEKHAKNSIQDPDFEYNKYFAVCICYLTNYSAPINLISPHRTRINGVNCYSFIIGSFKVFFKCDKRKLPDSLQDTSLFRANDFLMFEEDGKRTPEHKILCEMYNKIPKKVIT